MGAFGGVCPRVSPRNSGSTLIDMKIPFIKMEGAGNDYVYVNTFSHSLSLEQAADLAPLIADRHFGVGADGLILLAPSDRADLSMVMWNADGSRGAMCGNGLRCVAKLAVDHGVVSEDEMLIETDSGLHRARVLRDDDNQVVGASVEAGAVRVEATPRTVTVDGAEWPFHRGNVGNPHAVIFIDQELEEVPVSEVGSAFQRLPEFPDGVNVEFVRVREDDVLEQRTFERGAGETLACGSGAVAAACAARETDRISEWPVTVELRGGTLRVEWEAGCYWLMGPARTVFSGKFPN